MSDLNNNQTTLSDGISDLRLFGRRYVFLALVYCFVIVLIFHQTAWSMVEIWWRSETFAHGFLIVPIVCWLVWRKRHELALLNPSPQYLALIPLFISGLLWLFGDLTDAAVVRQLTLIGVLLSGLWLILGSVLVWTIAFPLAFLFLAVPMGEGLIPGLMGFTASFTVALLKLTGIPVYREGMFFSLPSGNWAVVEACSGVRYLIASVTLGCLFAYLTYTSLVKRGLFIAAAIVVPIFANGLRAYMIVMIGHLSSMKLAQGVDHIIYGWLWFGVVIFVLFAIGSIWRDHDIVEETSGVTEPRLSSAASSLKISIPGVLAIFVASLWPLSAYLIDRQSSAQMVVPLAAPEGADGWVSLNDSAWRWSPVVHGPDNELLQFYQREGVTVSLYAGQFLTQQQNKELINSQNVFVAQKSPSWRISSMDKVTINLSAAQVDVDRFLIKGSGQDLLALRWYRLGKQYTANPYLAKVIGGAAKLTFARQDAAYITITVGVGEDIKASLSHLQDFIDAMLPGLENRLDRVVGR